MKIARTAPRFLALFLVLWLGTAGVGAEEIVLKDGQKIVGSIVGYENDMFRVQTEFGFALVRKDKVATINVGVRDSAGGKPSTTERERSKKSAEATPVTHSKAGEGTTSSAMLSPPVPTPPAKAVPPASHPLDEPLPTHIQERVEGTNYINETFHFAMFKPPGWKVYEGVPHETGSGIMAMGSDDEQTLFIVDRQVWSGLPDLNDGRVEARLRRPYQEYQKLSQSSAQVDGAPAVRRTFRGLVDSVEWHGVSVHVARGNTLFGIIGLTSAETYQFQQAVFDKIIKSFHFLDTPSAPSLTR